MIEKWIVRVCVPTKEPLWVGTFDANGRTDAKKKAKLFVTQHFPLNTNIMCISSGDK